MEQMSEGMFYLSSAINGIELSITNGKLRVTAETSTQKWEVLSDDVDSDSWNFVEVTWSPESGLHLYSNNIFLEDNITPIGKWCYITSVGVIIKKYFCENDACFVCMFLFFSFFGFSPM